MSHLPSTQNNNNFNDVNSRAMNGGSQDAYMFNNQEPNPFEASFQEPNYNSYNSFMNSKSKDNNGNGQSSRQSSPGDKEKSSQTNEEDAEAKRLKFLERNRIAASKCRQKKKLWMQQLATQADQAAARNKALQMMVNQLKDEVLVLKNQLLAHRNCSCNVIQQYIQTSGQFSTMGVRPPIQQIAPQPQQTMNMLPNLPTQSADPTLNHKGN